MSPNRLDRNEMRHRLGAEAPGWVVDELADAFEPAFLSFKRKADEAARKRRRDKPPTRDRRSRQGRARTDEGDAE